MIAPLLTVPQVAERLGLSTDYCYRVIERGELAATRLGRMVRVTEESLAAYVAERTAAPRRSRRGTAA